MSATVGVAGQSLLLNAFGSNFGTMFVTLDEFSQRRTPELYCEAILNKLRQQLARRDSRGHDLAVRAAPGARGRAAPAAGCSWSRTAATWLEALQEQVEYLVRTANPTPAGGGIDMNGTPILPGTPRQPAVEGLTSVFRANVPQIYLDVDRTACMIKGVELRDVFKTLQAYLGRSTSTTSTASAAPGR